MVQEWTPGQLARVCGPPFSRRGKSSPCSRKPRTVLFAEPVRRKVSKNVRTTAWTWRIEEHLGWRVEVVRHPPQPRGEWVPRGDRQTGGPCGSPMSDCHKRRKHSAAYCPGAGQWSGPLPGCAKVDDSVETTSGYPPPARRSSTRRWGASCCGGWLAPEFQTVSSLGHRMRGSVLIRDDDQDISKSSPRSLAKKASSSRSCVMRNQPRSRPEPTRWGRPEPPEGVAT
jgi:hypothetical protein